MSLSHGMVSISLKVQGKDRLVVKYVAEQLGLEGSYVPRTYIEQIQLEKLVNEVMAFPDDLKTKLSIDDDLVASPKEALSRALVERVTMRNKNLNSGTSHSYSTQGDKNLSKLTGFSVNNRRLDDRTTESPGTQANQIKFPHSMTGWMSLHLRIEELNSKLTVKRVSSSPQNMALQAETCNGSAPTSYFISGLGNGSLTGSIMPNSSSSSQLAKEYPLMDEISNISRGQCQIMHQLENLSNLLRETLRERPRQARTERQSTTVGIEPVRVSLILTLAVGGLGIFLFRGFLPRN
ncbi:phosphoribulokinase [Actinidia rufa]|uniref:Phosphoribulokinase n=1 Tax=Actinidia rufa TaxID=165716 RepID=A0A7J0HEU7_9ERIC|nr:phosphoribulokinase [Actinidia rufa]